jgi:hypothetical protein
VQQKNTISIKYSAKNKIKSIVECVDDDHNPHRITHQITLHNDDDTFNSSILISKKKKIVIKKTKHHSNHKPLSLLFCSTHKPHPPIHINL